MNFFCFSKINNMVTCNRVDGKPCLCDLVEPAIQGFIREVSFDDETNMWNNN